MEFRDVPLRCTVCGREVMARVVAKTQSGLEAAHRLKKRELVCKVCRDKAKKEDRNG